MSGWGRIASLLGVGVLFGAGCGGRTGALDGDFGLGADGGGAEAGSGSLAQGGTTSIAGRTNRGGRGSVGGAGPLGGYGGTVVYPSGGYGGAVVYPSAGYAGTLGLGGAYPIAGSSPIGGYATSGGYGGQSPVACGQCLLQACSPPLTRCLQDFGCVAILSCVQSMGCEAFQCYSDNYCRGVIDQWGGPFGQSMNELLETFSCAVQAGCPCN